MFRSGLKLLLVEDNPDHAALARGAILKAKHQVYDVDMASSVEEAMDKLKNKPVNMVLSDFHLPGKTGIDFLEWINQEKMNVPFVMITGSGDEKTAVKAMQAGAYNYIVKDDSYLDLLPHVIDETFLKFFAEQERERYEQEIRDKNVQLEKANRELKKLDQLKSDFISAVSHDLRTPLNSIQESIALIIDGVVDPKNDQGKNVLAIAKRSLGRLKVMIDDLLDFSKLEAGKMRLHLDWHDVQILIDEVLGSLRSLAEKKKIKFDFKPVDGFPKVNCDADRMIQVLTNLVGNAIKFTPDEGTISVRVEGLENGRLQITVADTGIGIPKEDIDRVFEKFEQVKATSGARPKGTGLGLAICKELVKLHGGDIWAESEMGKGSRFIVSIPNIFEKGAKFPLASDAKFANRISA